MPASAQLANGLAPSDASNIERPRIRKRPGDPGRLAASDSSAAGLTRPKRPWAAPAASDRSDTARTCARSPTRPRPPC
ncbi:hypothetical protein [Lysobacter gummosus]|uniref:hypothetical protein n=1 Tax=Lysobacter gummosus TaxID=262324 RepID=UPI00362A8737